MQVGEDFRVINEDAEYIDIRQHNTTEGIRYSLCACVETKSGSLTDLDSFMTGEWFMTMQDALECVQDVIEND